MHVYAREYGTYLLWPAKQIVPQIYLYSQAKLWFVTDGFKMFEGFSLRNKLKSLHGFNKIGQMIHHKHVNLS